MDEPIEEVYFNWLYSKVAHVDNPTPSLTYYTLFQELHSTEFAWILLGDDNRAQDGLDVRREFMRAIYLDDDLPWEHIPCSVLEMLIAFSRRVEYETETGMNAREWFWVFLENLGLNELNDASNGVKERAQRILEDFVWRTYRRDGRGGMFPLNRPKRDQRKIEIWYQFCEWLIELENS